MSLKIIALATALLLVGGALRAQEQDPICSDSESINECANRVIFNRQASAKSAATTAIGNDVSEVEEVAETEDQAGSSSGGSEAKSTFTDLIPWLNMLGLLSDSDQSDGTIALDLNFLTAWKREDAKHDSQLKWQFNVNPTPADALIGGIPEADREERKKQLEQRIKDTADSELQYSYSLITNRFGRDFRQHQRRFAALLTPILLEDGGLAGGGQGSEPISNSYRVAQTEFAMALRVLLAEIGGADPDAKIGTLTEEEYKVKINRFISRFREKLTKEIAGHLRILNAKARNSNISTLADLVLQQPQLLLSANRSIRDELVGPESWGLKLTFEGSFVNLNTFLDSHEENCSAINVKNKEVPELMSVESATRCAQDIGDYVAEHAEDMASQSRWKASLEYKKVDRWRVTLPDDEIEIDRPKFDRLVASLGFGRAIRRTADIKDRVDVEASYDSNLDDDDTYKDRLVVTLTYTRRFEEVDIPFSVVYANKSEFLEGVDRQIGVHIGVKFRALD